MPINTLKCELIHFSKNSNTEYQLYRQPIHTVHKFKDLGLVVDDRLSFRHHATYIRSKACKLIGMVFLEFFTHVTRPYILNTWSALSVGPVGPWPYQTLSW